jgi:hypothetical protein
VTLDPDEAAALAEKVGADDADPAALAANPAVIAEIQTAVERNVVYERCSDRLQALYERKA